MPAPILEVRDLAVQFATREGPVKAVNQASLSLAPGEIVAVVGESGSGKTTLALSTLRLLPFPGRVTSGSIHFDGRDILALNDEELRRLRGSAISMIFQDPVSGLNPVLPIGKQVEEILASHLKLDKKERKRRAIDVLRNVGLADPDRIAGQYPFHLSGGMCQRVMIGMATALNPKVIVADEPTSSLDVTIQAQILAELDGLRRRQNTAILLITHDFGVVAQIADRVAVMYGGAIVEQGAVHEVFREPRHPYTWALLNTLPRLDGRRGQLRAIPGNPPSLLNLAPQCSFAGRCTKALLRCRQEPAPALAELSAGHLVACYNPVFQDWADDAADGD
ncbi:MAG: ABC transporter ATP-binding protein [Dehalococcoidia bacterium]